MLEVADALSQYCMHVHGLSTRLAANCSLTSYAIHTVYDCAGIGNILILNFRVQRSLIHCFFLPRWLRSEASFIPFTT